MKQLNYQTLQDLNYDGYLLKDAPERILQFGEGNFMRAFVDFFIDKMNETADFNSKVVLVQPIPKFTTPDVGILSMNKKDSTHCTCAVPKMGRKSLPNA